MNDFFSRLYFDNEVKDYLIVFGVIAFILLLNRIISKYFAGLIFSVVRRVSNNVDKESFIDLVIHPLGAFLVVLISLIALHKLKFPGVWDIEIYRYTLKDIFHAVGTSVLIVSFIWLVLRTVDFIAMIMQKKAALTADIADNQLIQFFKDFSKIVICIVGILMILHFAFNLHIGNLFTGLSIVGAAIALSLRESLENLIASFVIFFDKPFLPGDIVKVQNITGTVERIGLRSTRIRTDQKTYVTVPNKQMVDSILDNLSLRTQRRADLRLEIDLNTPSTKVQELIGGIKNILKKKEIEASSVLMDSIAGNAFMVNGEYYTAPITQNEFNSIKEQVNISVVQLMEALEVQIAGANREIRIIDREKQEWKQ